MALKAAGTLQASQPFLVALAGLVRLALSLKARQARTLGCFALGFHAGRIRTVSRLAIGFDAGQTSPLGRFTLGAFTLGARCGVTIVGRLATPRPQNQGQQIQQCEKRDGQDP